MDRKLNLQTFCFRSSGFPERETITTESSVIDIRCSLSSKTDCTDFQEWSHCKVLHPQCHSYYTAYGPRSNFIHATRLILELLPMKMQQNGTMGKKDGTGCYIWHVSGMVFDE